MIGLPPRGGRAIGYVREELDEGGSHCPPSRTHSQPELSNAP